MYTTLELILSGENNSYPKEKHRIEEYNCYKAEVRSKDKLFRKYSLENLSHLH